MQAVTDGNAQGRYDQSWIGNDRYTHSGINSRTGLFATAASAKENSMI